MFITLASVKYITSVSGELGASVNIIILDLVNVVTLSPATLGSVMHAKIHAVV